MQQKSENVISSAYATFTKNFRSKSNSNLSNITKSFTYFSCHCCLSLVHIVAYCYCVSRNCRLSLLGSCSTSCIFSWNMTSTIKSWSRVSTVPNSEISSCRCRGRNPERSPIVAVGDDWYNRILWGTPSAYLMRIKHKVFSNCALSPMTFHFLRISSFRCGTNEMVLN
jgi:hypothetical protein